MTNDSSKKIKKIVTHSGNFHTDEVFSCAVLSLVHGGAVEIVRSRESEVWETGDYVVDVGSVYNALTGRFDHHQEGGAGERENGIPYSSLGLVWKEFGEKLAGSKSLAKRIDEKLVQPIDAADCGINSFVLTDKNIFPYLLHHIVSAFRPTWKEDEMGSITYDEGFVRAFDIATELLKREIIIARDIEEGIHYAREAYEKAEDKRIIIIEGIYPWEEVIGRFPEPLFVVRPDKDSGRWKVNTVLVHHESFVSRKDLPKTWAGKRDGEFAQISGVHDAQFCHNRLFIAVAGSKEGAIALARIAIASE